MKGSIRFFVGLLICFGAVGADETTSTATILAICAVGLVLMYSGVTAMNKQND